MRLPALASTVVLWAIDRYNLCLTVLFGLCDVGVMLGVGVVCVCMCCALGWGKYRTKRCVRYFYSIIWDDHPRLSLLKFAVL